jgi:malate/lactate dehydrogenase
MRDWALGAPKPVSMGVWSDGNPYGVPEGLYYSFPVKLTGGGSYEIVGGLAIDDHSRKMMDASAAELVDELALANSLIK